jgi:hypothetical protein
MAKKIDVQEHPVRRLSPEGRGVQQAPSPPQKGVPITGFFICF